VSFDARTMLELLPAVYRIRDEELASRIPSPAGPLEALLAVLADEVAVLEENVEQLYDDQFVETCAPWAIPYIGDLIGYRLLHGKAARTVSRRAEVAHTIGFRRRKGTASMLEQLARDVTGWNARVVEFFQLLATTQYMNHVRPANRVAPDLRNDDVVEWVGTAFDPIPRTLDVRRMATSGGRYNIPNIGIFLWRIDAHRLLRSPATPHPGDASGRRFRFSPLGQDIALYTRPEVEDEITHLAEPINVPAPIGRRIMNQHRGRYYGDRRSVAVYFDGAIRPPSQIRICNLSDDGADWAHDAAPGTIAIDPELGRLVVAADVAIPQDLSVTFHYGSPGAIGGGEYARDNALLPPPGQLVRVPNDRPTVQDALDALGGAGVVEITDNGRYAGAIDVDVTANESIELRAAAGRRPTLVLPAPMQARGGEGSAVIVNGLVIAGQALVVPGGANQLRHLRITHATLVPGRSLGIDGAPQQPDDTSLEIERPDVEVEIERSVLGAVRIHAGSKATATDTIIDACSGDRIAGAAPGGADPEPAGEISLESCTVIGELRCESLYASNSILLGTVTVVRRQEGCVRFSFLPLESSAPRRFRCQPIAGRPGNFPRFTSLRYGAPGYCQLTRRTPAAIRRGAEDESEMGVFRFLFQPQRESDLVTRLDEYLRIGLEAGIFYES
jgi:hypothetical protein